MKNFFLLITLSAAAVAFSAETNLPAITVTAAAQTPENAAIHDVLRSTPGVVLNTQGGSQNDLSIRGSSFSGAGLSLGGLTLRNAQTEHFHAELPIPATMLSRPEIQTGLANQGGHLVGSVAFDLLPMLGKKQVEIGFGTDHRDWQSVLVQQALTNGIGLGVFAGRESAEGVDYPDNDYNREYAGAHLQYAENETQVDFVVAHQEKDFGARGYYGVNDALPAQEATEDTLVFLSAMRGDLTADYIRAGFAWRQVDNDYRLPTFVVDTNTLATFRNQHRSRTASAFVDGRTFEVNGWALGWRADVEEERIASTGSYGGLGYFHRTRGGISLLPQWTGDRWKFIVGARAEFFTEEDAEFLPQLGVEYMVDDPLTAFASYSESVRLPSYTELNYNSPASLGNANLQPQTAAQTEIGLKGVPSEFIDWKISAFHRRSKNTIDWSLKTETSRWTATDIGTLDTYGVEAQAGWYPAQNLEAQLAYTWIYKDRSSSDLGVYASRYALDYPEHLLQASLLWRPFQALELGTVQNLRLQTDNEVRKNGDFGADSSFVIRYTPSAADWATVSLLLNNAWDDDFQHFPSQRPPERFMGISLRLNL